MSNATQYPILIPGAGPAAGRYAVTSPYDGRAIAEVETSGHAQVDHALATAEKLYRDRANWLPTHQRIAILEHAAEMMAEQFESLAVGAAEEGGKPLVDSRIEVGRAIDSVKLSVVELRTEQGRVIPMGGTPASANRIAFTRREPIGVVVAVSAFNHPLNLIVHQVATAVAAGCPVIVKPAGVTPLSCIRFVEILHEAGLDAAWCQVVVTDDNEVAQHLVTDPRVAFFTFVGSARVGWMLRSKLAPGTRFALEHGGAAPLILAEDADLDAALPLITKGGYYHAGQVCVSVQRLYAHPAVARPFADALARSARALVIGDPVDEVTEVGPLIRHAEVDRIGEWVDEAVASGAERLAGGDRLTDALYPCTVLYNPPDAARVSREEIFGPVVCIYEYVDVAEAIERANSLPYAFQGAVFTASLDTALQVFTGLDASAVMVNDHTAFRIDGMPFAGLNQSGYGVGGIPYTMHDMTIEKMMVIKSPRL